MELGKEEGREDIWNDGICLSQSLLQYDRALLFRRWLKTILPCGKWGMNSLADFACMYSFCLLYEAVFISTHGFSHFCSSDSLPHPYRDVSEQLSETELPLGVKP